MQAKTIKHILIDNNLKIVDLAAKLGTSSQNLSQKLKRDNFSEKELQAIAAALGCDLEITFIDRATGKRF